MNDDRYRSPKLAKIACSHSDEEQVNETAISSHHTSA
jgi:hypothetical protein